MSPATKSGLREGNAMPRRRFVAQVIPGWRGRMHGFSNQALLKSVSLKCSLLSIWLAIIREIQVIRGPFFCECSGPDLRVNLYSFAVLLFPKNFSSENGE